VNIFQSVNNDDEESNEWWGEQARVVQASAKHIQLDLE